MAEADLEQAFCDYCEKVNAVAYKLVLHSLRGWPDRTVILPGGGIFFVEFKAPGKGRLQAQQVQRIRELRNFGHRVYVCDNLEDSKKALFKELADNG